MANTTDWIRGGGTLPQVLGELAVGTLKAVRRRRARRCLPLTFPTEPVSQATSVSNPAWNEAYALLAQAACRARRAARRQISPNLSAWALEVRADLTLSDHAMGVFPITEIRAHPGVRTFAKGKTAVAVACEWLAGVAGVNPVPGANGDEHRQRLIQLAELLDDLARELHSVLRLS